MIYLNDYLYSFPRYNFSDKIGITELNKISLNSMPNSWYKQAYAQWYYCEYTSFKKVFNMFEKFLIDEYI